MAFKNKDRKLAQTFHSSSRYMDDVISLNNSQFVDYPYRSYPNELEVKDTQKSAFSLTVTLKFTTEEDIKTKLYEKRDDFTLPIVNFPFISSNTPASPAYGVYISHLIRYSRACVLYSDFLDITQLFTKSYSNKVITAKNYTVVIIIWLTATKYPYLK